MGHTLDKKNKHSTKESSKFFDTLRSKSGFYIERPPEEIYFTWACEDGAMSPSRGNFDYINMTAIHWG